MKRMLCLMAVAMFLLIPISNTASACFPTYPSILLITLDQDSIETLSEPLPVEEITSITMEIGYSTMVPSRLLLGGLLARLWVFKGLIIPPTLIHLEEQNIPEGIDIAVVTPEVYINDYSNHFVYTTTDLVITPTIGTPPGSYYVDINAQSSPVGRILSTSYTTRIFFEVAETP